MLQLPSYRSSQAHTARDQIVLTRCLDGRQHAKLACSDEVDKIRNQSVDVSLLLVGMSVGVGRLIAERCAGSSCGHCDICDEVMLRERKIALE